MQEKKFLICNVTKKNLLFCNCNQCKKDELIANDIFKED